MVTTHGPIEPDKENIRQEPYSLPQGFMWDTLDLSNAEVVCTVYTYMKYEDNMETKFLHSFCFVAERAVHFAE